MRLDFRGLLLHLGGERHCEGKVSCLRTRPSKAQHRSFDTEANTVTTLKSELIIQCCVIQTLFAGHSDILAFSLWHILPGKTPTVEQFDW